MQNKMDKKLWGEGRAGTTGKLALFTPTLSARLT
jgi:hypothetical protein